MKKFTVLFLVVCLLVAALPVFAEGELIGVAMPTNSLQRWNQDGANMKAKLEEAGYKVELQYANNDVNTQISQLENMILNECKVIVIASIDGSALSTVIASAKEAGIPTIAYDRLIRDTPDISFYTTFDNYGVGTIQGTYIKDTLDLDNAGDKTYNIEFFGGSPDDNNAGLFNQGAMDVLQPYIDAGTLVNPSGQIDFKDVAILGWGSDDAAARMDTIISGYYSDGTKLDVVLSPNDSLAWGIITSLENNGWTEENWPIITGQDCDVANVIAMKEGKQSMSVFKDTRTLAEKTIEIVEALVAGKEPETNATYDNGVFEVPSYNCTPVFADKNNYEELLVKSGYYTEDQLVSK